jgi:hypothetical protein
MKPDKSRVHVRLEKKIAVLRKWVSKKIPEDCRKRMRFSIKWVAEWSDPELGVEAIGSPNAISKNGPYRDLVGEVQELLVSLQKTSRAYRTRGEENAILKAEVKDLKRVNKNLSDQWHVERDKRKAEETALAFTRSTLAAAELEIGRLREQLTRVIPLRPLPAPATPAA